MRLSERIPALIEGFSLLLVFAVFVSIGLLVGGTRMAFSLPVYIALGSAGVMTLFCLGRAKPAPCRLCLVIALIAFAYVMGRAWFSPLPYIARSDLYSALAALVVYFLFALFFTSGNARMVFLVGLLALALTQVLVGVIQFRDGTNFMPISWLRRYDYGNRASGFYGCPNHFAGLLEVIGVMGLSIACWSRWPVWSKLLIGYGVACCYVGLIITGSRGGYLSTGASLLVFALLSLIVLARSTPRLFWSTSALGLAAAISVGALVIFAVPKSGFLLGRAQAVFDTGNIRRDLWVAALEQWKLSPLLGTGGATYLYYGRLFRTAAMQRDPVYVHNDYLQLLAEYGLIGAALIALMIGLHLQRAARNFIRLGPKRVGASHTLLSNGLALNLGALAAVAAFAVHEVLDFNLHIPANALLMAFVFAILANHGVVRDREQLTVSRADIGWRIVALSLAALLAVQSARLFPSERFAERARAAVRDNKPAVAIRNVMRGLEHDANNPDLHHQLGNAKVQFGDIIAVPVAAASFYNDAIAAFMRARALAPQEEIYLLKLAGALDSAERYAEAEWVFDELRKLDPRSVSLQRYYDAHLERWRKSGSTELR